jgi:carboxypeptidase C (cathepsin A)
VNRSFAVIGGALVCGLALATVPLGSQSDDRIITTSHQVTVNGKPLRYTARAGHVPIRDNETGEVHGRMFFVAYTSPRRAEDPPRPVTFLWNGGPGSSSSLVHLLGFGPRRIGPGNRPIDNQGTWLDFSDLVFIDPIGTGYSRPVKAEYGPEFYQARGDAESVAEFIRVYRNRFDAATAPVMLAGESYGVTRAAGVADVLERRGIRVSGTVLIGLALPLGSPTAGQRTAHDLPTYTATAFAHRKLEASLLADLQATLRQSEAWAIKHYEPALARRDALTDAERAEIVAGLARFTGFDASLIDRKTLAIPMTQFSEQLLRDTNRMIGRYDSRLTAPFDPEQVKMYDPRRDPSLVDIIDDVAVVRYLRQELGFESDLPYQGPFGGGYPPPTTVRGDWMSVRWNRGPASAGAADTDQPGVPAARTLRGGVEPLRRAMTINPALTVLNMCGYYDLVCSYFGNEIAAAELDAAVKARVTVRSYAGGHAVYTDDPVRLAIKRDVAAFAQRAVGQAAVGPAPLPQPPASSAMVDGEQASTQHEITISGRTLRYTATAGLLPIRINETGEPHGNVFYVAYRAAGSTTTRRPLTFLWNGGPGSNATLLHLVGFGPKRLADSRGCVECEVEDNDASWLDHSDLVFVDPVGTGFSRPTRTEYGAEFYNTLGDIASIAEFVRVYLTRFDAWDAPLFIAGESYGAWRASGVAEALEQRGTHVAGVMLISGGIHVGPVIEDELRAALFVPTRTAAAFAHRKLSADLQKDLPTTLKTVETWARNEYAPALKRLASLTDQEREAVIAALARFTGLDAALIDRKTLVVARQQFAEQLLRDQKKVLARFDTRDVEGAARPSGRNATVNRYLRSMLAFKTDLAYQGNEDGFTPSTGQRPPSVAARWNYNQGEPGARVVNSDGPPGGAQPWLRRAMALNPSLRAFAAAGLYDSLNSCAANAALVSQLEPPLAANIIAKCYDGGHMMYEEPAIRRQVTSDIAVFYRSTLAARPR